MAISYPVSIDSFTDPTASDKLNSPAHHTQHADSNSAIEELEAKVGIDSSAVTGSHDYKLSSISDGDKAVSTDGNQTVAGDKTFSGSTTHSGSVTNSSTVTNNGVVTNNKASKQTLNTASDGATVTFDLDEANIHEVTLGGNRTLALSNADTGQAFVVRLIQDGTGSRTVTWFSTIKWSGGSAPTLSTDANAVDVFGFICTGTDQYDGYIVSQNLS